MKQLLILLSIVIVLGILVFILGWHDRLQKKIYLPITTEWKSSKQKMYVYIKLKQLGYHSLVDKIDLCALSSDDIKKINDILLNNSYVLFDMIKIS